jgi:hypothetical protein
VAVAVPPKTDGRWQALLTGAIQPRFSLLATRLLVARLRQEVKQDSAALAPAIDELHTFFTSNEFVARDLAAL